MSDDPAATPPPPAPTPQPRAAAHHDRNIRRWIIIGAITFVGAVILFFIGAAFLPRWWAHRIGDQIDGSATSGIGIGLFYGSVFTFVPLVVLWLGFRKRRSWKLWLATVIGAAITAIPNLLTLGIVLGRGNAAHAGERILDVEGTSFRNSSLIGAIGAAVVFVVLIVILRMRRRAKDAMHRLEGELRAREAGGSAPQKPAE
jgi:hypothetical protein